MLTQEEVNQLIADKIRSDDAIIKAANDFMLKAKENGSLDGILTVIMPHN